MICWYIIYINCIIYIYMDVYVIRYWWITCGWNINRIKWMGFSAESQILGTEKRVPSMGLSYVRIHLVDLYGQLVGINIPIPWIPWVRDKEWFLLKRKNSRSCTYKYLKMGRVTASSPGKAGARRGNKGRPCGQVRRDNVTYSDWSSFNSLRKHTKKGSTK